MTAPPRPVRSVDLVLDKRSTIPVYLQLKHHIVHLVSSGAWRPGMSLPSVRQLAAELGLATATVQRAYGELQELGILVGQAGRGVFVAELANRLPELPGERASVLHGLLARAVAHALSLGFSRQEIIAEVRELVVGKGADGRPRVVFVGSGPETAEKYRDLLAEALGDLDVVVTSVTMAEVRERGDALLDELEPIGCLVGLVRAFAELRHPVAHRGTPLFGLVVDLTARAERALAELPADVPIGLVAQEAYLPSARTIVHRYRGAEENLIWAESHNRRAVRRVIRSCPVIVHTFGVKEMLTRLAPGARLVELEYLPTPSSIEQLRALVAPATSAAGSSGRARRAGRRR